ncbi:vWA domain-containing protein [Demequina rhizosphaerae]|uniref:vWA domain-containing protein n=1 Tax=Demequina rhizosphaerae TaxID=1638985 RepID=UPI0007847E4C|nr:VWA domain-containing protein [Demequina rhizosphaerae]
MVAANLIELDDLVDNPTARVPIILCLDCSTSMRGARIKELNAGVASFYKAISSDEIARYSAEISIVTFGPVQKETDFQTVSTQPHAPKLTAAGNTPLGEAVELSLDLLERRKQEYKDNGIDYYQPWLVLMTDGAPFGGSAAVLAAQVARVQSLAGAGKLAVFPIGIGDDADMSTLNKFTPGGRPAFKLQGLNFQAFFSWLSASVSRVSQSTPGDGVELDAAGIQSWATFKL